MLRIHSTGAVQEITMLRDLVGCVPTGMLSLLSTNTAVPVGHYVVPMVATLCCPPATGAPHTVIFGHSLSPLLLLMVVEAQPREEHIRISISVYLSRLKTHVEHVVRQRGT